MLGIGTNNGESFGWSGNYYQSSYGDNTWYASMIVMADDYTAYIHHDPNSFERKGWSGALIGGYQLKLWRFNLLTGFGVQHFSYKEKEFNKANLLLQQRNRNVMVPYLEVKLAFEI